VLALVREGLTNEEIAGRLGITLDGAKFHVSEILMRLGVRSRHEAAEITLAPAPARRAWALAPLALLHRLKWSATMTIAAGAATAAAGIAIVVLAWGVMHTNRGDGTGLTAMPVGASQTARDLRSDPKLAPLFAATDARDVDALLDQVDWQTNGCGAACPPDAQGSIDLFDDAFTDRQGARPPLDAALQGIDPAPAFIAQSQSQPAVYLVGYNARTDTPVPGIFGDPSTTIAGVIFHIDTTHARPITTLELTAREYDTAVSGVQHVLDARGDLRPLYVAGVAADASADPDTLSTTLYQDRLYAIELRMPSSWVPDTAAIFVPKYELNSTRFADPNDRLYRFAAINAMSFASAVPADAQLDAVVAQVLQRGPEAYGNHPMTVAIHLDAGDGRLVLPDPAQPYDPLRATVILPYPKSLPGTAARAPFGYLLLSANQSYIMRIAETLRFVDPATTPAPVCPPGGASHPGTAE
jgi:hypothetical protein